MFTFSWTLTKTRKSSTSAKHYGVRTSLAWWMTLVCRTQDSRTRRTFTKICRSSRVCKSVTRRRHQWYHSDQTEILLRFHRNNPKLCLMAKDGDYNIKHEQSCLFHVINPSTQSAKHRWSAWVWHTIPSAAAFERYWSARAIKTRNGFRFPVICPARFTSFKFLPRHTTERLTKTYSTSKISVEKDTGLLQWNQHPVAQGLDYSKVQPELLYHMTLSSLKQPESVPFSCYEFKNGYMIICFDLSDQCKNTAGKLSLGTTGTLRVVTDYNAQLAEPIILFCVGLFPVDCVLVWSRATDWTTDWMLFPSRFFATPDSKKRNLNYRHCMQIKTARYLGASILDVTFEQHLYRTWLLIFLQRPTTRSSATFNTIKLQG